MARLLGLIGHDLGAFLLMRAGVRLLRDHALLGTELATWLGGLVPRGYLGGWGFPAALLAGLAIAGTYGPGDRRRDVRGLFVGTALAVGLTTWGTLWAEGFAAVPGAVLVLVLVGAGLSVGRVSLDRVIHALGWQPQVARTLFVGTADDCAAAASGPAFLNGSQHRAVASVDVTRLSGSNVAGALRDAMLVHRADAVVVCSYLNDDQFAALVDAAVDAGCELLAVPRRFRLTGVKPTLIWERDQPLIVLASSQLKAQQLAVKRVIDITGAALGLVFLAPVFLLLAVAIRLESPGRVLFSQERVGLGGRVFRLLKFRTMRHGADAEKATFAHLNHTGDPRLFKIPDDPRVTNVGTFLRRWSWDELPQLWNVLRGDMSLVGPRPFFEADLAVYADHHFRRLGAKPGITGLWQVKGRSSVVDFEEVVRLDREYIDRWSIWLDLRVLVMTLPAVLRRTGAY